MAAKDARHVALSQRGATPPPKPGSPGGRLETPAHDALGAPPKPPQLMVLLKAPENALRETLVDCHRSASADHASPSSPTSRGETSRVSPSEEEEERLPRRKGISFNTSPCIVLRPRTPRSPNSSLQEEDDEWPTPPTAPRVSLAPRWRENTLPLLSAPIGLMH
mmetsp:Transcript_13962/g.42592  ORF Transcript_13962/g.42592 Transcript_13962/m.42592 type:complete len:164 (+) Transcript_13962:577-1068(+)